MRKKPVHNYDGPTMSTDARRALVQGTVLHWTHWLAVGCSLLLTFGAWYVADKQITEKNRLEFERQALQVVDLVQERMQLYENALRGGVAFIDANDGTVDHPKWREYAESLHIDLAYPGINGIGVIFNVKPDELPAYLAAERKHRPSYQIHPDHNQDEFWPITYIEPETPNQKAVGLDMAFETNRYTAVKKARDTGLPQVTGPITLVQDSRQTPGFLFYSPFYRSGAIPESVEERQSSVVGVTYAPFIMSKLMRGTLSRGNRQVQIKISDGADLLYNDAAETGHDASVDPSPLFSTLTDLEIYGRTWTFDIDTNLAFRAAYSSSQPLFILGGGLLIDVMLLGLFIALIRANRKALKYADQMTDELKEQSDLLARSNADLEQFAYIASHDLKAPLNSINQIVGWIEEDCEDILPEESKKHLELLKSRSKRLMKLLTDLLEYSQVGRISHETRAVNIQKTAQDVLSLLGANEKFGLEAPDTTIQIPGVPFETIVRNLLSNTVKHHDGEAGKIQIRCNLAEAGYELEFEDDGPGIPDDLHEKAMAMFQTLRPRDQVEGSGMGLSLVKKIVETYDGTIRIVRNRQRGLEIHIFWPTAQ
jgi:CHASE1-domain containing sensor protein/two-component sensor histidine kinase